MSLCEHEVTESERTFLNMMVTEGLLSCEDGVYSVRDKLIATLWDFVDDNLKS